MRTLFPQFETWQTWAALGRWLGPWTASEAVPRGVGRRLATTSAGQAFVWESLTRAPRGVLVLVPGLHPDGVFDRRLDRLARIFAHAGAVVVGPVVPEFMALALDPSAEAHVTAAAELARTLDPAGRAPAVFSISFGSILALRLAARMPLRGAVLFGGYRHVGDALTFALTGAHADPLNGPVIFANLAPALLPASEVAPFRAACHAFCVATWGRPDQKLATRRAHAARAASEGLSPAAHALFRQATRLAPGAPEAAQAALADLAEAFAWLDPGPVLPAIACPVHCLHGRDDDVIPHTQAALLARDLPNGHAHVTGLYGHTGASAVAGTVREIATMRTILDALTTLV